jgi:uncharacterized protein YecA (UPF0149 family)
MSKDQLNNDKRSDSRMAMQKLATNFAKKKIDKRTDSDTSKWQSIIKDAIDLQKGKIPLLLAVEAGNQSMVRELLSAQTTDQLKVSQ